MRIYTMFFGVMVGVDELGNSYYQHKKKSRRWVLYKGLEETTKVPPEWRIWLHHIVDSVPDGQLLYDWQKSYLPNLTGTLFAYYPHNSLDSDLKKEESK